MNLNHLRNQVEGVAQGRKAACSTIYQVVNNLHNTDLFKKGADTPDMSTKTPL